VSPKRKKKGGKNGGKKKADSGNAANIFAGQGGQGSLFGGGEGEKKEGEKQECKQQ
jgi:hypothetical protein